MPGRGIVACVTIELPPAHDALVVHVYLHPDVDQTCLGYALDRLRGLVAAGLRSVDKVEVWLSHTGHPAMPTALMATGLLTSGAHLIRARGVAADPREAVDALCGALRDKIGTVPLQRTG